MTEARLAAPPDDPRVNAWAAQARVCVTGGGGFIGGWVVDELIRLGASVTVLDDFSTSDGKRLSEQVARSDGSLRVVDGSVLDAKAVAEAVVDCSVVFHLGALASVPRSIADPARTWAVNATGTATLIEGCRLASVKRVVYSASSSAYGDSATLPKVESAPIAPLSPYAASKAAGEHAVASYAHAFGVDGISLRYFNVIGPYQPADSPYAGVVPSFVRRLARGEAPVITGDGGQTRDFTPVRAVVRANLLAAASTTPLNGAVVNVGAGGRITIDDLAKRLCRIAGRPGLQPIYEPARPGDVRDSQADLSRAGELLGYSPMAWFGVLESSGSDWLERALEEIYTWYAGSLGIEQVSGGAQ